MKRQKFSLLFLLMLLVFTVVSCNRDKDDEQPEPEPPTVAEMLASGPWIFTDVDVFIEIPGFDIPEDQQPVSSEEFANTTIEFRADGTLILSEDGETETGTWELLENDTKVRLNGVFFDSDDEFTDSISPEDLASVSTFTINKITETEVELRNNTTIDLPIPDSPVILPVTITFNMDLGKR
ncbi:MAG: hypothetical protein JJT94_10985 [Bernardetiaceae bacterium]|nr:hypothetical protein [Bernardetiaceae bacterium]